jgi:hypothetical protein
MRQYEPVPEQPMDQQLQVDCCETKQKTTDNKEINLYFNCFGLAHSRHKYMNGRHVHLLQEMQIRCLKMHFNPTDDEQMKSFMIRTT